MGDRDFSRLRQSRGPCTSGYLGVLGWLDGRVVDGDSVAEQVEYWRVVCQPSRWFTIVPQGGAGLPADPGTLGAQDCGPYPWQEGLPEDELEINNKEEDKDVDTEFIGAKSCKPKDKDDDNNDTENINKMDLPGACQKDGKGPLTQIPTFYKTLKHGLVFVLLLLETILAHSGSRYRHGLKGKLSMFLSDYTLCRNLKIH